MATAIIQLLLHSFLLLSFATAFTIPNQSNIKGSTFTFSITGTKLFETPVQVKEVDHNAYEDDEEAEGIFDVGDNWNEEGGDENEDEDDDMYLDEGQSYNIDYDDTNIIDVKFEEEESYYSREEDDMLTEREDRLYMDEKGESTKKEKCILIAVEDVAALRRDRHNALKMSMLNENNEQFQLNPEEWEVYFTLEESMNEMRDLISTCGMQIVGEVTQRLNQVNPKTYIGTGKVKETQELLEELDSCTVIFDAELSPGQQKSLENAFNREVLQNDFMGSEQLVSV
jgi:hypothetical protein